MKKQETDSSYTIEFWGWVSGYGHAYCVIVENIIEELGFKQGQPMILHCDNILVINIAKNPSYCEPTKHMGVDCHFIWEKTEERIGERIVYTSQMTRLQIASQK